MPKEKSTSLAKVKTYIDEFPKEFTTGPRNELFCSLCSVIISHERRYVNLSIFLIRDPTSNIRVRPITLTFDTKRYYKYFYTKRCSPVSKLSYISISGLIDLLKLYLKSMMNNHGQQRASDIIAHISECAVSYCVSCCNYTFRDVCNYRKADLQCSYTNPTRCLT